MSSPVRVMTQVTFKYKRKEWVFRIDHVSRFMHLSRIGRNYYWQFEEEGVTPSATASYGARMVDMVLKNPEKYDV